MSANTPVCRCQVIHSFINAKLLPAIYTKRSAYILGSRGKYELNDRKNGAFITTTAYSLRPVLQPWLALNKSASVTSRYCVESDQTNRAGVRHLSYTALLGNSGIHTKIVFMSYTQGIYAVVHEILLSAGVSINVAVYRPSVCLSVFTGVDKRGPGGSAPNGRAKKPWFIKVLILRPKML